MPTKKNKLLNKNNNMNSPTSSSFPIESNNNSATLIDPAVNFKTTTKYANTILKKPKFPDYFVDDNQSPETWTKYVTQLANLNNVNERQICSEILPKLPSKILRELAARVNEILEDNNPWEKLKLELLKKYKLNKRKILDDCIRDDVSLGDRKPSELLNELKVKLNNIEENKEFIRTFFLRAMPEEIRIQLIAYKNKDNEQLAEIADEIYSEKTLTTYSIKHAHIDKSAQKLRTPNITYPTENENPNEEILIMLKAIKEEISELKLENKNIKERLNKNENVRRDYEPRHKITKSDSKRPLEISSKIKTLCWYHENFGSNAYRCQEPCDLFSSNSKSHLSEHQG